MVEIPLNKTETDITPVQLERIGPHSHIKGLGLNDLLQPAEGSSTRAKQGLVGQKKTRQALGVVKEIIKSGKLAGRAILLAGPPGTGKTALAHALSLALGPDTPFNSIAGSEIYSHGMNKTESLTQALRRAIAVRIKESTEIIEGEVVSIEINPPTADQTESTGKMVLKTTDMEAEYDLGMRMIDQLKRLKIVENDIISIDVATGNMTKLGHSQIKAYEFDARGPQTKFVPTPTDELRTKRETVHTLTLHEIDVVNSSQNRGVLQLFSGDTGEIKQEVREHVDNQVAKWQDEKKGELILGVLFIDEVYMLDLECFSFLNRAIESTSAPIVIMASNRGKSKVIGTTTVSPHGIPFDMLQRLLIIPTGLYEQEELQAILQIRLEEEDVQFDEEALDYLVTLAESISLRYAMQLIALSSSISRRKKEEIVSLDSVQRAYNLFSDPVRSIQYLKKKNSDNEKPEYISWK